MFSVLPTLVFASQHHRSKKFHTGRERAKRLVAIWFLHRVSQLNVTRIVSSTPGQTAFLIFNLYIFFSVQFLFFNPDSLQLCEIFATTYFLYKIVFCEQYSIKGLVISKPHKSQVTGNTYVIAKTSGETNQRDKKG